MSTSPLRRLIKNASILLSGGAIGAGLAFLASLVAARYLGAAGLGRIVLVQSLVLAVDRFVNFQSWRTVIKYGADARASEGAAGYASVLKFGTLLDVYSALAGAVLAVAATFPAARLLDWSPETHRMAMAYGGLIVFNLTGTPTAVLRANDRFGVFVVQRVAAGTTKLVGVIVAWVLDTGPLGVLAAWMVGDLVAWLSLVLAAGRELVRRGEHRFLSAPLEGILGRHPGILRFALITNVSTSIRMASRQIDDFIIGALLSESAVGLYKIAKQFGMLAGVAGDPLAQAAYPDMARQVADGDRRGFVAGLGHAVRVSAALAVPFWLVFLVAGGPILRLTVGPEFVAATGILVWYTGANALWLVAFFLPAAVMALGRPQASLTAITAGTVVYFVVLVPLVRGLGLVGAGVAYVVYYCVWTALMLFALRRHLSAWTPDKPAAGAVSPP